MKISDFQAKLEMYKTFYGDIEVCVFNSQIGPMYGYVPIEDDEISVGEKSLRDQTKQVQISEASFVRRK